MTEDNLLLASWLHYLAIDLFLGSWVVLDARGRNLHRLQVLPCLLMALIAASPRFFIRLRPSPHG